MGAVGVQLPDRLPNVLQQYLHVNKLVSVISGVLALAGARKVRGGSNRSANLESTTRLHGKHQFENKHLIASCIRLQLRTGIDFIQVFANAYTDRLANWLDYLKNKC